MILAKEKRIFQQSVICEHSISYVGEMEVLEI